MGLLSIHPSAPHRPYLSWQRKVKMQLDSLLEIKNPDTRTRGEIESLRRRLKQVRINLDLGRPLTKKCSDPKCSRQLSIDDRRKQCAFCRERKRRYERKGRRNEATKL